MIMQYYPDKTLRAVFSTVREAADSLGTDKDRSNHIRDAVKGRRRSAYGYLWSGTLLSNNIKGEIPMKVLETTKAIPKEDVRQYLTDSLNEVQQRHMKALALVRSGEADETTKHYVTDIALLLAFLTSTNNALDALLEEIKNVRSEQTAIHSEGCDKESDSSDKK